MINKENIVIFGAGYNCGKLINDLYNAYNIVAVMDNDLSKIGTVFKHSASNEMPLVINPPEDAIKKINKNKWKIYITPFYPANYHMYCQLSKSGIDKDLILNTVIGDISGYDRFIQKYIKREYEPMSERLFLDSLIINVRQLLASPGLNDTICPDPFSQEYHDREMGKYHFLSGQLYNAAVKEGLRLSDPSGLFSSYDELLTDADEPLIVAHDELISIIDVNSCGKSILELGCGSGILLCHMAQRGFFVTGIEASSDMCMIVHKRLEKQGISNCNVINGVFEDFVKTGCLYDCVIFEASYHHSTGFIELLHMIYANTPCHCKIFFVAEPFIQADWIPPWGINCYSGEALLQIRLRGWFELIFNYNFILEVLKRTGWIISSSKTVLSNGYPVWIAEKNILE